MIVYEKYTAQNGITVIKNPNSKIVSSIKSKCEENKGHCPCNPLQIEDTICPCKDLREAGKCHCSLYVQIISE